MSRLSKALTLGLLTAILGLIASLVPVGLDLEENIGLDLLFRLRGAREVPSDVIIVTMDKASTDNLNLPTEPEKWPRSLHAASLQTWSKEVQQLSPLTSFLRSLVARGVTIYLPKPLEMHGCRVIKARPFHSRSHLRGIHNEMPKMPV